MSRSLAFATLAFAALAACGGPRAKTVGADAAGAGGTGGAPMPPPPPMPLVHVGPDVSLEIPCGASASAPIASLSNPGAREISWKATTDASPSIFTALPEQGTSSATSGVTIVKVLARAPLTALPGDIFTATFTVSSPRNEFPAETVTARARIIEPAFEIDPAELDFGEVPQHLPGARLLGFRNDTRTRLVVEARPGFTGNFSFEPARVELAPSEVGTTTVIFKPYPPGQYAVEVIWKNAQERADAGAVGCSVEKKVSLRGRGVPSDGGAPDVGGGIIFDGSATVFDRFPGER